jgi:hypothetical protein
MMGEKDNCCIIIEIFIVLLIIVVLPRLTYFFTGDISSSINVMAILVAIGIYYWTFRHNQVLHEKNQISLVESLLFELNIIEEHIDWYISSEGVPEHEIRKLSLSEYGIKLNKDINSINTKRLKYNFNKLQDKIILINNYANWIINLHLTNLKKDQNINNNISNFYTKIKKTLPDAKIYLKRCRDECYKII